VGNPAHAKFEDSTMTSLYVRDGGEFRKAGDRDVIDRANAIIAQRYRSGAPVMDSPSRTREFLRLKLGALDFEVFAVLFLTTRHTLIEYVELFRGTIDGASVHPREVAKECLARGAAAVILAHCHPSGNASPSQADELITRRLRDSLALLDVRVLDHLIVAADSVTSMAELGLL
jgi:DNA repair protein RadC